MMNTTTVTRFGQQAAPGMAPMAAPAMQPAVSAMQPAMPVMPQAAPAPAPQDAVTLSGGNAAPSVQFDGLGKAFKNWFKASKEDAAVTFDLKAERKKAATMLKERELIPAKIEEKRAQLEQRRKDALQKVVAQHGPLNTLDKQKEKMEKALAALNDEQETAYQESLSDTITPELSKALDKELIRLETEKGKKQDELDKHLEKMRGREAIVEMYDMQLEVIEEAIVEANELLDEANHSFEMAKLLDERLKVEEELSLSNAGVLGEVKTLHAQATSYEGEKRAAVEHYIGMSIEEQLAERQAKKQLDAARTEHREKSALDTIKARLEAQRAEAEAEKTDQQTAEKTNETYR